MPEKPVTNGDPKMQVAALSETGRRPENQDLMSWSRIPWGDCYIVADGMGGYKGGAVAARMTVEGLENYLKAQTSDRPFEQALQEAASRTNEEVYRAAQSGDPEMDHMGSTVAVALVSGNQLVVGHVGDSRVYLVRHGRLKLLTTDHTSVQRMVDAGMITEDQARTHPEAHILSRAMGSKADVEIEIRQPIPLEPGDGILLCSDGLSGYVKDRQIEKIVGGTSDVQRIPKQLVDLALESGGDDNITVQFVRYGKPARTRSRHTAKFGPFHQPLPKRLVPWAAGLVLAVAVLAFPLRKMITHRNIGAETMAKVVAPPAKPPAPGTSIGNGGASQKPDQPNPPDQSKKENVVATSSGPPSHPAGPSPGADASPHEPAPARPVDHSQAGATAGDTALPAPVLIFLRSSDELPLAQKIEHSQSIQPTPTDLPPRNDTDLDEPPLTQCFIFYPDRSLQTAAMRLKAKLDKIHAVSSFCGQEEWKYGLYKPGVRSRLRGFVEGQAGEQYLLIAFPKKKD